MNCLNSFINTPGLATKKVKVSQVAIEREYCRRKLKNFVKFFWSTVVPNDLVWNWHMDALCDEIQAVDEQVFLRKPKLHDLIINVPPGTSKTKICSVMATAWEFARKPDLRIFVGSYSDTAVLGISDDIRIIMNSPKYRQLFPEVQIRKGKNSMHNFKTTKNGEFFAFTVGGTLTSKHADILKVDDPINPKTATSEVGLNTANEFMSKTLPTRKVDKAVTPTVLIMQRLHANDPTGNWIEKNNQAEFPEAIRHIVLPGELTAHTTEEYKQFYQDGLMDSVRMSRKVLSAMKVALGSVGYEGQFGQNPTVPGGNIIKEEWYQTISQFNFAKIKRPNHHVVFFADTAYTAKTENDPSAIIATCRIENDLYIMAGVSKRLEFNELVAFLPTWVKANGWASGSSLRIEPKASGKSIVQYLKKNSTLSVMETPSPTDDKMTRLKSVQPIVESGRVYLIIGGFNEQFIQETTGFPNKLHDEFVDLLCYACDYHFGNSMSLPKNILNGFQ